MTALDTDAAAVHSDADRPLELVCRADVLTDVFDIVRTLVDECLLRVTSEGLRITAVDPATVAMVDVELDADAFESYAAADGTVGVDLTRLGDALDLADGDQLVHLFRRPERGTLRLVIGGFEYTIALLDPAVIRDPPSLEDLEYESEATVGTTSRTLAEAVRAAETLSDHIELGVTAADPAFYATATGDTDEMELTVPATDLRDLTPESVRSLFSLDYLTAMVRGLPRDRDVRLRLGESAPLELRFDIADGDGAVRYVVSPRIQAT